MRLASARACPQDVALQYTRKNQGSTVKFRQVVPGLKWEVVPTPVIEVRQACGHGGLGSGEGG
jgi:hypothetical protein